MAISRVWYIILQVLYLVLLAITWMFLNNYTGAPGYAIALPVIAVVLLILSMLIKEYALTVTLDVDTGAEDTSSGYSFWVIFYVLMMAIAITLFVGAVIISANSKFSQWWCWAVLVTGIIFVTLATGILGIWYNAFWWFTAFAVIGAVLMVISLVLFLIYVNTAGIWWVWMLFGLMLLFCFISLLLEPFSKPSYKLVKRTGRRVLGVQQPIEYKTVTNTMSLSSPQQVIIPNVEPVPKQVVSYYYATPDVVQAPPEPILVRRMADGSFATFPAGSAL